MGLLLHSKHGVNPTTTQCYYCNEASEVWLVGAHARQFTEAGIKTHDGGAMPMSIGVMNTRPCPKCKGYMEQGVILISVKDDQGAVIDTANIHGEIPNPYRTGGWVVIRDDAVRRMIKDEKVLADVLKRRMCFIPDAVWDYLQLPRGGGEKE
jgi:hypothetical protein